MILIRSKAEQSIEALPLSVILHPIDRGVLLGHDDGAAFALLDRLDECGHLIADARALQVDARLEPAEHPDCSRCGSPDTAHDDTTGGIAEFRCRDCGGITHVDTE